MILLIEYGLGVWVNLYGHLPASDHGANVATGFARAVSNGPAGLSIHALLGLILIVPASTAMVRAVLDHLAELHGGTIRAESDGEGRGSTFIVELPARPVAEAPPSDERLAEAGVERAAQKLGEEAVEAAVSATARAGRRAARRRPKDDRELLDDEGSAELRFG